MRSSATPADAAVETSHCSITMWVFCTLLSRRSLNSKTSEVHAHVKHRAVAQRGARTAPQKGVQNSALILGSMVRMGLTKTELAVVLRPRPLQPHEPLELHPRDRSDSSNCRSSFPGARTRVRASIMPGHTKKSPFVLHHVSNCIFHHPSIAGEEVDNGESYAEGPTSCLRTRGGV